MQQKMTKIEIITRPDKLEPLKDALVNIGVAGMTVTQVYGCGLTRGHLEVYRGQAYNINLVPKIKLETVVCEVPVDDVLAAAKKVLQTGQVGDGKIFIYPIENAIRIRTWEVGDVAIIDRKDEK